MTNELRIVIDVHSSGTAQGKTTLVRALDDTFRLSGIEPTLVRIESSAVASTSRHGGVFIATERLLDAADIVGGAVGTLQPLWVAFQSAAALGAPMIIDWPGGQSGLRADFLVATGLDDLLAGQGYQTYSVVCTTCSAAAMIQAAEAADLTAKVAPHFQRVLALNAKDGGFDHFPKNSPEARAYHDVLMPEAAKCVARLEIPRIEGHSWAPFESAELTFRQVLEWPLAELVRRTDLPAPTANSCKNMVAAWWRQVQPQLIRVFQTR